MIVIHNIVGILIYLIIVILFFSANYIFFEALKVFYMIGDGFIFKIFLFAFWVIFNMLMILFFIQQIMTYFK